MKKPQNHDIVRGVLCRKFRSMVRTSTKWTKVTFLLSHGLCESGKQMWLNWVLWVWAFDKVGLQSRPETYRDPPVSTLTSMIVDRIQLLKIATLSVSTAQGHLSRPLHRVAHNMVADFQRLEQSRAREGQQAGLRKNISVSHWHLIEVRMWSQSISKHIWARLWKGRREMEQYLEGRMLLIEVKQPEKSSKIIYLGNDWDHSSNCSTDQEVFYLVKKKIELLIITRKYLF